eukprot:GHVU01176396.1.p1 GENE.GHVU01176396.1~~GHVU01176396.1.p1  ORF type:complete len:172 (+),score=12.98 GHVU01176396.1:150-665(+)
MRPHVERECVCVPCNWEDVRIIFSYYVLVLLLLAAAPIPTPSPSCPAAAAIPTPSPSCPAAAPIPTPSPSCPAAAAAVFCGFAQVHPHCSRPDDYKEREDWGDAAASPVTGWVGGWREGACVRIRMCVCACVRACVCLSICLSLPRSSHSLGHFEFDRECKGAEGIVNCQI